MRSPPTPLLPVAVRAALWLLVVAVLTVQMLSLLHGVAHAGRFDRAIAKPPSSATAFEARQSPRQSPPLRLPSWVDLVFAGHGGIDCDAFDHASHADSVFASLSSRVAAPPVIERTPAHIAWHIAAQARGFLARGPPVVA